MTSIRENFYVVELGVVEEERKGKKRLLFEFEIKNKKGEAQKVRRFARINAAAFISAQPLSSVPVLVYHGQPPEFTNPRNTLCISSHGKNGDSVSIGQYNRRTDRMVPRTERYLEASWFNKGDTLFIFGHGEEFTEQALEKFRK